MPGIGSRAAGIQRCDRDVASVRCGLAMSLDGFSSGFGGRDPPKVVFIILLSGRGVERRAKSDCENRVSWIGACTKKVCESFGSVLPMAGIRHPYWQSFTLDSHNLALGNRRLNEEGGLSTCWHRPISAFSMRPPAAPSSRRAVKKCTRAACATRNALPRAVPKFWIHTNQ